MAEWSLRRRMTGGDLGRAESVQHPDQLHLGMPGSPMVLQILLRISQAVLGANFLDEALEAIAEETRIVMRASSVSISRWEPDIDSIRTLISVGDLGRGEPRWPEGELYRVGGNRRLTELLEYGRPYAYSINDAGTDSSALAQLRQSDKEAAVAVPLAHGDSVWGAMWVSGTGGRRFDHDDIQLLQAIAAYATVAIGRAELFSATWQAARQDPLTGLANRRALDERMLKIEWSDSHHTVLVCDLDGFKLINDREGHAAGDEILCAVATILSAAAAEYPDAMVARLGGDEFCILLPHVSILDAEKLVSEVNAAIGSEFEGRVAATWGAAEHTWAGATGWELLHAADIALQHAKSQGRERFSYVSGPQMILGNYGRPGGLSKDDRPGQLTARVVELLDFKHPASPLAALEILALQAQHSVGAAGWAVMVTHADTNALVLYRQGHSSGHKPVVTSSLDDYPATARAIATDTPLIVDIGTAASSERDLLTTLSYRAMVVIPVKGDEHSYVLTLYAADSQTRLVSASTELRVLAHYCVSVAPK